MVGIFEGVKQKSSYCFIKGYDGKMYFCHQSNLKNKDDWCYVWNGNECSFQPQPNTDKNKKDLAVEIIPLPKTTGSSKTMFNKKQSYEKVDKAYCKDHLYYVILYRSTNKKESFRPIKPLVVWKDKQLAEENLYFHMAEKGDIYDYILKDCLVSKKGSEFIVKELLIGNRVGNKLYNGNLKIYQ